MFRINSLFSLIQNARRVGGVTRNDMAVSNKVSLNVATFNLLAPCHKRLNKDHNNRLVLCQSIIDLVVRILTFPRTFVFSIISRVISIGIKFRK